MIDHQAALTFISCRCLEQRIFSKWKEYTYIVSEYFQNGNNIYRFRNWSIFLALGHREQYLLG